MATDTSPNPAERIAGGVDRWRASIDAMREAAAKLAAEREANPPAPIEEETHGPHPA